jgi:hypothetical protein
MGWWRRSGASQVPKFPWKARAAPMLRRRRGGGGAGAKASGSSPDSVEDPVAPDSPRIDDEAFQMNSVTLEFFDQGRERAFRGGL